MKRRENHAIKPLIAKLGLDSTEVGGFSKKIRLFVQDKTQHSTERFANLSDREIEQLAHEFVKSEWATLYGSQKHDRLLAGARESEDKEHFEETIARIIKLKSLNQRSKMRGKSSDDNLREQSWEIDHDSDLEYEDVGDEPSQSQSVQSSSFDEWDEQRMLEKFTRPIYPPRSTKADGRRTDSKSKNVSGSVSKSSPAKTPRTSPSDRPQQRGPSHNQDISSPEQTERSSPSTLFSRTGTKASTDRTISRPQESVMEHISFIDRSWNPRERTSEVEVRIPAHTVTEDPRKRRRVCEDADALNSKKRRTDQPENNSISQSSMMPDIQRPSNEWANAIHDLVASLGFSMSKDCVKIEYGAIRHSGPRISQSASPLVSAIVAEGTLTRDVFLVLQGQDGPTVNLYVDLMKCRYTFDLGSLSLSSSSSATSSSFQNSAVLALYRVRRPHQNLTGFVLHFPALARNDLDRSTRAPAFTIDIEDDDTIQIAQSPKIKYTTATTQTSIVTVSVARPRPSAKYVDCAVQPAKMESISISTQTAIATIRSTSTQTSTPASTSTSTSTSTQTEPPPIEEPVPSSSTLAPAAPNSNADGGGAAINRSDVSETMLYYQAEQLGVFTRRMGAKGAERIELRKEEARLGTLIRMLETLSDCLDAGQKDFIELAV